MIYRRIDDDFLDPKSFRADSLLGVPGLMDVYRAGRVALANAPGTGVADDKVVYAYVPEIDQVLPGRRDPSCRTCRPISARDEADRKHVLEHLDELVVKAANESGGYGMLVGPHSTKEQQAEFARADRSQSAQLHRPADAGAVARADDRRRRVRRAARRPAALHPLRQGHLRAAGRPHARRAAGRARWSSTRRRAAAARTPGCSPTTPSETAARSTCRARRAQWLERSPSAQPRRRLDLLDEPLRRAGGERRALHRRQPQPDARPARRLRRSSGSRSSTPPATTRSSRSATARRRSENVIQFLTFDHGEPELDPLLPARGARERALGARDHLVGDVGAAQRVLPDGESAAADAGSRTDPQDFFAVGQDGQPSVHGRHRRDDDARRELALLPAGPHAGARRQDLAHPRREVLPPAARRRPTSARRPTTSSGPPCCARPAPSRCTASATAASRRIASSSSCCSIGSSRGRSGSA